MCRFGQPCPPLRRYRSNGPWIAPGASVEGSVRGGTEPSTGPGRMSRFEQLHMNYAIRLLKGDRTPAHPAGAERGPRPFRRAAGPLIRALRGREARASRPCRSHATPFPETCNSRSTTVRSPSRLTVIRARGVDYSLRLEQAKEPDRSKSAALHQPSAHAHAGAAPAHSRPAPSCRLRPGPRHPRAWHAPGRASCRMRRPRSIRGRDQITMPTQASRARPSPET
jgi:hypothetical protein